MDKELFSRVITVKNAEGDSGTQAKIIKEAKINYDPKVSVIIPVYNAEKYLRECLDSVVNQTLKEIEIICVDDGSTDSSLAILKEYAEKDGRFTIVAQNNLHAGVARNAGLALARGKYLSFLDSDDFFELNMFEKLYEKSENTEAEICIFETDKYDNKTEKFIKQDWLLKQEQLPKKDIFSADDISKYIYNFSCSWAWNKLFNHEFIKTNQIKFQALARTNDLYFTYLALSLANKMVVLKECLLHYRVGLSSNLQANNVKSPLDWYYACKRLKQTLQEKGIYTKFEQSLVNCVVLGSQYNYNSIADNKVKNLVKKAIKREVSQEFSLNEYVQNIDYFYNKESLNSFLKTFLFKNNQNLFSRENFLQHIFSIKNTHDKKHKVLTIFGLKIKFRRK